MTEPATEVRHREIAVEHLLFWTIRHVEKAAPGLLDALDDSLDHLGDPAGDATQDNAAVRDIAKRIIDGARRA